MLFIVQGSRRRREPAWRRPSGLGRRAAFHCVRLNSRRTTTLISPSWWNIARRSQRGARGFWDRLLWAATCLFVLLGISCGASRDASALDASPEAPILNVGERIQIQGIGSDEVAGELEWEVMETYGGGLLLSKGVVVTYVAPPAAGTYHLMLRAPKAGGGTLRRTIPVQVRPVLRMEPAETTLPPGGTRAFAVRQKGLPRGNFSWSVEDPEGGSIGPDGIYHAPSTPGTYRVTATSNEMKDVAVSATITVQ